MNRFIGSPSEFPQNAHYAGCRLDISDHNALRSRLFLASAFFGETAMPSSSCTEKSTPGGKPIFNEVELSPGATHGSLTNSWKVPAHGPNWWPGFRCRFIPIPSSDNFYCTTNESGQQNHHKYDRMSPTIPCDDYKLFGTARGAETSVSPKSFETASTDGETTDVSSSSCVDLDFSNSSGSDAIRPLEVAVESNAAKYMFPYNRMPSPTVCVPSMSPISCFVPLGQGYDNYYYQSFPAQESPYGKDINKKGCKGKLKSSSAANPDQGNECNRKVKLKTELCMYFEKKLPCPFGEKCIYAHGEEELQLTKLMDLSNAGLIDILTHRTKPCFAWIATGSCPFGKRCTSLHDPRCSASSKLYHSWLPHTETQGNATNTDINVEALHNKRTNEILYTNPFGDHFSPSSDCFDYLYDLISNNVGDYKGNATFVAPKLKRKRFHCGSGNATSLTQLHKINIALQMRRGNGPQWQYKYRPQHIIFEEQCMVLQKRTFRLEPSGSAIEMKNAGPMSNRYCSMKHVILVYEIAFGPDSDPNVRDVGLWFGISEDDVTLVAPEDAKRFRLSRGPKVSQKTKNFDRNHINSQSSKNKRSSSNNNRHYIKNEGDARKRSMFDYLETFTMIRPNDPDAFHLTNKILQHRRKTLNTDKIASMKVRHEALQELKEERKSLEDLFNNLRRQWIQWGYPINIGREYDSINENTPAPSVHEYYCFSETPRQPTQCSASNLSAIDSSRCKTDMKMVNGSRKQNIEVLSDTNDDRAICDENENDALSSSKDEEVILGSSVQPIWESFASYGWNNKEGSARLIEKNDNTIDSEFHCGIGTEKCRKWRRLPIFQRMASGQEISSNRNLPHIEKFKVYPNKKNTSMDVIIYNQSEKCWKALLLKRRDTKYFNEWDIVRDHFEKSRSKRRLEFIQHRVH